MKMKHSFVLLTIAAGMAFLFYACKKSSGGDKPGGEQPGKIQGMGNTPGTPQGTPFVLPDGVTTIGNILGETCDTSYEAGSGGLVEVCIALYNNKNTDITLTVPAGLILVAAEPEENQHGILIHETIIVLKANKLTRLGLNAYCINSHRDPSAGDDVYTLGPVTSSTLMKALIEQLKNKKVNREHYPEYDGYSDVRGPLQDLVWSISDGLEMPAAERTRLLALIPNK